MRRNGGIPVKVMVECCRKSIFDFILITPTETKALKIRKILMDLL